MPQPFDLPDPEAFSTAILARLENGQTTDAPYDLDAAHADDEIQESVSQEGHVPESNEHDNPSIANGPCSYANKQKMGPHPLTDPQLACLDCACSSRVPDMHHDQVACNLWYQWSAPTIPCSRTS